MWLSLVAKIVESNLVDKEIVLSEEKGVCCFNLNKSHGAFVVGGGTFVVFSVLYSWTRQAKHDMITHLHFLIVCIVSFYIDRLPNQRRECNKQLQWFCCRESKSRTCSWEPCCLCQIWAQVNKNKSIVRIFEEGI